MCRLDSNHVGIPPLAGTRIDYSTDVCYHYVDDAVCSLIL